MLSHIRIGPDRAYHLHFTLPQLLLLLQLLQLRLRNGIEKESISFCIWSLSFEILKFHALIRIGPDRAYPLHFTLLQLLLLQLLCVCKIDGGYYKI